MTYTLVCLRCGRDLEDWQLVAHVEYCATCHLLRESEREARERQDATRVIDTLLVTIVLTLLLAMAYLYFVPLPEFPQ